MSSRKPLDARIPQLISNGVASHTRSFFLVVGSSKQQHSQIVNLHYLLSQSKLSHSTSKSATARPSVLWCYKKELAFTSNRKKREGKIKRDVKRGIREDGDMDPFELFVGVTDIRYCYYRDTDKILGRTYGMLILQDFEAITPNLLARTIETVQGGGIVVLLLQSMKSLKQLYTMSMDVHSRYRTESSEDPIARFNERFILSLGNCRSSLILDDELNVLPISVGKDIKPIEAPKTGETPAAKELKELVESLQDTLPVGSVVPETVTLDQAQALLTFTDALSSKSLSSTVTLTAARGRGKSAALGLAVALAVSYSYSNIFVTSPHPDNLATFWQFVFKGFDRLGYKEFLDYDIVKSSYKEWNEAVVRVNVFRNHRQTIQYIQPQDAHVLGQAELVVIDEAAAIPLPLVKALMGPYLVFMASTINGYEGTGRSLSLKLIQSLRELSRSSAAAGTNSALTAKDTGSAGKSSASTTRSLREIKLDTPIRYGQNDAIEKWLNSLLCLDSSLSMLNSSALLNRGAPHPSTCDLYAVNRDTLFSYHQISEVFLQKLMALFVSSHYKNSPNDLQLLSDAPNHLLFVLLPPIKEGAKEMTLPEPLVVLQVALEGRISKQSVMNSLARGIKAGGDLIPWTVSQQFQDDDFATLSGARIVRIATNPEFAKMGYGSRALSILLDFFSGKLLNLDEVAKKEVGEDFKSASKVDKNANLSTDVSVRVRDPSKMPPLLQRLSEIKPQNLDWLGVSYGLTPQLLKFWKRAGYVPLYLRQTQNELTGEHTCVMLRGLGGENAAEAKGWLSDFALDFRKRFIALLSFKFRDFPSVTALSMLEAANAAEVNNGKSAYLTSAELREVVSPHDMKRLTSYGNNMLDYHVILDLLPSLASLYFSGRFPAADLKLSGVQSSILLALGLQRKVIEDIETELKLPVSQALALFVKVIRKVTQAIEDIQKKEIDKTIPEQQPEQTNGQSRPSVSAAQAIANDLEEEGDEVTKQMRAQQREVIDSLDLKQYAIANNETAWESVKDLNKVVSVRNPDSSKRKEREESKQEKPSKEGKKHKKHRN